MKSLTCKIFGHKNKLILAGLPGWGGYNECQRCGENDATMYGLYGF